MKFRVDDLPQEGDIKEVQCFALVPHWLLGTMYRIWLESYTKVYRWESGPQMEGKYVNTIKYEGGAQWVLIEEKQKSKR